MYHQLSSSFLAQLWLHQKSRVVLVILVATGVVGSVALGPFFPFLVLAVLPFVILVAKSKEESSLQERISSSIDWAAWREILGEDALAEERHSVSDFFYIAICLICAVILGPFVIIPLAFSFPFLLKKGKEMATVKCRR